MHFSLEGAMGMARWWRKSFCGLRMGLVSCALPVLVGALLALSPWAHAQTELTLVTWFEPGSLDPVIEAFEAENPDIRVVVNFVAGPREALEAVLVRNAGGGSPDGLGVVRSAGVGRRSPCLVSLGSCSDGAHSGHLV